MATSTSNHPSTPACPAKAASHPLDPLCGAEYSRARDIILAELQRLRVYPGRIAFASIHLNEPERDIISRYDAGERVTVPREAAAIIMDRNGERLFEVIVDVQRDAIVSWNHLPGVNPPLYEYSEVENVVKSDPQVIKLLKARGATDAEIDALMVDMWVPSLPLGVPGRIANPLMFLPCDANDNGYARPVDGIEILVDMNHIKVISVKELFFVPIPPARDPYTNFTNIPRKEMRVDLKPLIISQPEGPSFKITGRCIEWQNWRFRVGWTPREGLVLHTISYFDKTKGIRRSVLHRASVAEMVVPYGDPRHPNYQKNALDAGEDGLGRNANSLTLGCDCVGAVQYMDVDMLSETGANITINKAVCIHEEDAGILWKHTNWRTGEVAIRRSRVLIVSFFTTITNYDYGFYWTFTEDGQIKCEAKLTGILSVSALAPGTTTAEYGTMVAPQVYASVHHHFFTARLHCAVDTLRGGGNTVAEVNTDAIHHQDPVNPYKGAFKSTVTEFHRELDAGRDANGERGRFWKILNRHHHNRVGNVSSYRLVLESGAKMLTSDYSDLMLRTKFIKKHVWVTPYKREEKYPTGAYPVLNFTNLDNLYQWVQQNRPIHDTDVVTWVNFGTCHVPRTEEWPIMCVEKCGFTLKPDGFFDANPALDVAEPTPAECPRLPDPRAMNASPVPVPAATVAAAAAAGCPHMKSKL